jgi:asparagine synthase (glutamine-hydrolysing)
MGGVRSQKAADVASVTKIDDSYFMFRRSLSDRDLRGLGIVAQELELTPNFQDPELDHAACLTGDAVSSVGRLETKFYLGNTLLRDGDVFGMANSLEIRVPFLDRDVVDWAQRLPGSAVMPMGGSPKHLLRAMCADFFSVDQLRSPKQGFALPMGSWLKGPLAPLKDECIRTVIDSGLVAEQGVRMIEQRYADDPYRSGWTRVWALLALGRWLQANPSLH